MLRQFSEMKMRYFSVDNEEIINKTENVMPTNILDWGIRFGIPADFWVLKEQMVGEFIAANKLSAVTHEAMRVDAHPISEKLATVKHKSITVDYILNIRGGRRTPHLHYKGDLYILDAKQWKAFSAPLLKEFGNHLATANSIGFENFIEIGESISAISHL
jgi:hypothetical protein